MSFRHGQAREKENQQPEQDQAASLENLSIFRKNLRQLLVRGERDTNVQTAIIKKVVHKITIKPDGFEIFFHVGKSYFLREPRAETLGSLFISFKVLNPTL